MDENKVIQWTKSMSWVRGDKVEVLCVKDINTGIEEFIVNVTIAYKTNMSYTFHHKNNAFEKYNSYKSFFFDKHLLKGN